MLSIPVFGARNSHRPMSLSQVLKTSKFILTASFRKLVLHLVNLEIDFHDEMSYLKHTCSVTKQYKTISDAVYRFTSLLLLSVCIVYTK